MLFMVPNACFVYLQYTLTSKKSGLPLLKEKASPKFIILEVPETYLRGGNDNCPINTRGAEILDHRQVLI